MTHEDLIKGLSITQLARFIDMCEEKGKRGSTIALDERGYSMDIKEWLSCECTEEDIETIGG